MKNITPFIFMSALAVLTGCSSENDGQVEAVAATGHEIVLVPNILDTSAGVVTSATSRATLTSVENLQNSFYYRVAAWPTGTTATSYLSCDQVYADGKWTFQQGAKSINYYWPSFNLDFFAYSPKDVSKTCVTTTDIVTESTGVKYIPNPSTATVFTYTGAAQIDGTSQADETLQEFAYASEKNRSSTSDAVKLNFNHPFATIDLVLNLSIRCHIKSLKISSLHNSGTFHYDATKKDEAYTTWDFTGYATHTDQVYLDFSSWNSGAGIGYPDDINTFGRIGGPFIVVPQALADDAVMEITYKPSNATYDDFITVKAMLNKLSAPTWVPGNKYTYTIFMTGDSEEIRVNVTVTPWTVEGETESEC